MINAGAEFCAVYLSNDDCTPNQLYIAATYNSKETCEMFLKSNPGKEVFGKRSFGKRAKDVKDMIQSYVKDHFEEENSE